MKDFIITMERRGKEYVYSIKAANRKSAIDRAYELAPEYAHIVALRPWN